MGWHSDRLREVIQRLPKPKGPHTGYTPELASICLLQLANGALQVIAELEERNEDQAKEIDRLTEALIQAGAMPNWNPPVGS